MADGGLGGKSRSDLGRALARAAYYDGIVRFVEGSLADSVCLVATMRGLFAIGRETVRLLCHGHFFGLVEFADQVFVFEACDRVDYPSKMGRILRFARGSDGLEAPSILVQGLDNGCHQITVIGEQLVVVDTYAMVLRVFDLSGQFVATICPIAASGCGDPARFSHMNSIREIGDEIHLVFHNGFIRPPRRSEVMVLDRDWQFVRLYELDGFDCHDVLPLADGRNLYCGSRDGELLGSDGLKRKLSDRMTRGLASCDQGYVLGTTEFAARDVRIDAAGSVIFLDTELNRQSEIALPAAPTCIMAL